MNRNVIYYPYIRVPQNEWFTRVLLYWDQIFSIVPMDYDNKSLMLGAYMDGLIKEDLVIPIVPGEYIHKIPRFHEAFLNMVDAPNYPIKPDSIVMKNRVKTFDVAMEKTEWIGDELIRRGLARKHYGMYRIEAYTANLFMAYLAGTLGEISEIESKPITDKPQNLVSFSPYQGGKLYPEIDEMRTIILNNILPAPMGYINPVELASFKNDHFRELNRFRNKIESFLPKAAAIEDKSYRSETISQFVIEAKDDIDDLSDKMKSVGWRKINLGRLMIFSATAFGLLAAADPPSGLPGVIAAAFAGGREIYTGLRERDDALEGRYVAYAVLARERFSGQ